MFLITLIIINANVYNCFILFI